MWLGRFLGADVWQRDVSNFLVILLLDDSCYYISFTRSTSCKVQIWIQIWNSFNYSCDCQASIITSRNLCLQGDCRKNTEHPRWCKYCEFREYHFILNICTIIQWKLFLCIYYWYKNVGTHWGNTAVKIHILQRFSYFTLHLCQGVWFPRMGNAIENHHDTFDSLQFVGNNVRYALINIINSFFALYLFLIKQIKIYIYIFVW